jgi:hypothetical protein
LIIALGESAPRNQPEKYYKSYSFHSILIASAPTTCFASIGTCSGFPIYVKIGFEPLQAFGSQVHFFIVEVYLVVFPYRNT